MLMVDKIHGIYGLLHKSILGAFVEVRKIMEYHQDLNVRPWFVKVHYFYVDY